MGADSGGGGEGLKARRVVKVSAFCRLGLFTAVECVEVFTVYALW